MLKTHALALSDLVGLDLAYGSIFVGAVAIFCAKKMQQQALALLALLSVFLIELS